MRFVLKIFRKYHSFNLYLLTRLDYIFSYSKEDVIKTGLHVISITNFLYISHILFTYVSSSIDYIHGWRNTEYLLFTKTDKIWFVSDKLIIFSLYYIVYILIKYFCKTVVIRWDLLVGTFFSFIVLMWQLLEVVNGALADNTLTQNVLTFFATLCWGYFCASRFIIYFGEWYIKHEKIKY